MLKPPKTSILEDRLIETMSSILYETKSKPIRNSLIHLMCAITHTHTSTHTTILMHVKYSTRHFFFTALIVWDFGMKKIKKQKHQTD